MSETEYALNIFKLPILQSMHRSNKTKHRANTILTYNAHEY